MSAKRKSRRFLTKREQAERWATTVRSLDRRRDVLPKEYFILGKVCRAEDECEAYERAQVMRRRRKSVDTQPEVIRAQGPGGRAMTDTAKRLEEMEAEIKRLKATIEQKSAELTLLATRIAERDEIIERLRENL